jgi:peroxiredoxin Q/BCP
VKVLGISPDPVERQAEFKAKENLQFNLLADVEHEVAEKYGVWVEKKMYGRTYWGNERTSFLIDAEGKIEHIFRKVKPKEHSEQVLAVIYNAE